MNEASPGGEVPAGCRGKKDEEQKPSITEKVKLQKSGAVGAALL
jgi:hypothetical protein